MNKSNKILLGILTFIVVCVIGYALFSDNISITGSATASGDWSITASCSDTIPSAVVDDYETSDVQGGFSTNSCTSSGNTISANTTLLYPTAMKLYHAEYKNTGAINAMFKIGTDTTNVLGGMPNEPDAINIELKLYNKETDALYKTYTDYEALNEAMNNYGFAYIDKVYIKSSSGEYLNTKAEILGNGSLYKDADGNYYLQIKPGESIIFILSANWYEDAVQTDYYSTMKLELDIKLTQQTDDLIKVETLDGSFDICINHC